MFSNLDAVVYSFRWPALSVALVTIMTVEAVLIVRTAHYAWRACPSETRWTRKDLLVETLWTALPAPFLAFLLLNSLLRILHNAP